VEQRLGHSGGEYQCKKEPVSEGGAHHAFYSCQGVGRRPVGEAQRLSLGLAAHTQEGGMVAVVAAAGMWRR
jgi:hypothetical protein